MVYIFLADGFEEVEALTAADVLRRGNVDAELVSIEKSPAVTGTHNITVNADITFDRCSFEDCDMLVLPGGLPGSTNLMAHKGLCTQLKKFYESEKKVAAICAAPMVLGSLGILEGKKATIYPGLEDKMTGASPTGDAVTVDGNVITGQGPGKAMEFALTLLEELQGKEPRKEIEKDLLF